MLGDAHRSRLASRSTLGAILLFTMSDITHPHGAIGPVTGAELFFDGRAKVSNSSSNRNDESNLMIPAGGARRDRTDDLLLAKQALSQLSYGPRESARLRQMLRRAAFACWRLAGRSCAAAKAGGPGKT